MLPVPAIDSLVAKMSVEQKVAQLFVVCPDDMTVGDTDGCPVGGYCIFARHFRDAQSLDSLVCGLKSRGGDPLMCIDEEGGRVARIGNMPGLGVRSYPAMKNVGRKGVEAVYDAALTIGGYLRHYGFNVDFAPVADVDTNPDNPVIGARAFSENPEHAAQMVRAFIRGLRQAGIAGCVKHFPGHGDTSSDSHKGTVESAKSWEEMSVCEIVPFRAGIEEGVPMVMVGHISTPGVGDDPALPASLSRMWITDILRGELGFKGVVITDSMQMEAITQNHDSASAAIMAIMAGVDIVLMPANLSEAYHGVVAAVRDGRISEERLDQSLRRILALKFRASE